MNQQSSHANHGSEASNQNSSKMTYERAANLASEAAEEIKKTASDSISGLGEHLRQIMDHQIDLGASVVGNVAHSFHVAAAELDQESPQVGKFAHLAADRLEGVASQLQNKRADELLRDVSDFTKRQPALVFGAAALAGFFALRLFKSATVAAPSIQPQHEFEQNRASEFHGA